MKVLSALVAILLVAPTGALPAPAAPTDQACLAEVIGKAPAPVAGFIRRYQACMVWNGDEAISAKVAHASTTPKRIRDLNCDLLVRDEAVLRKRYAGDRAALRALDRGSEQLC